MTIPSSLAISRKILSLFLVKNFCFNADFKSIKNFSLVMNGGIAEQDKADQHLCKSNEIISRTYFLPRIAQTFVQL